MGTQVEWEKTKYPGIYKRRSLRKRGLTLYRVVIQVGERQLTRSGFANDLEAARDWQNEHRKDRAIADPSKGRMPLQDLYELVHTGSTYAPATLALHAEAWKKIEPVLGDQQIGRITPEAIEAVLRGVRRPEMQKKTRALLSILFRHAVEKHWVAISPVPRAPRPKTRHDRLEQDSGSKDRKRYLNENELARLLKELPERWRGLCELMARVGLRPGEAVALTVGKFDPLTRRLTIDTSLTGFTKTGLSRTLVLPAVVAEMLTEHLARFSDPSNPSAPMFPREDGGAIDSKNALDAWRRRTFVPASERAGVNHGLTPNHLRHSAASFAIAHGANVYDVQKMLGHAKASITLDTYAELWEGSQERLAERLDEAIRESRVAAQEAEVVPLR